MKHLQLEVSDLATLHLLEALLAKFEGVRVVKATPTKRRWAGSLPKATALAIRQQAETQRDEWERNF